METRVKEGMEGEEKRGTSLSRKSPSFSKQDSPNKGHVSTSTERSIPNYLKPTISSGLDTSKPHVKKNTSSDVQKVNTARRRSLEKPLPTSLVKKPQISPNPRERNTRSSPYTSKTSSTSANSFLDRLSKAPKHDGKEHSLHPRPKTGKKSSITLKKQETQGSTFSAKLLTENPPGKVDTPNVDVIPQVLEQQEKDLDSSIIGADAEILDMGKRNVITTENILVLEDKAHVNGTQCEPESHAVQEVKMIEPSPILNGKQNAIVSATLEESEDKLLVREITSNQSEVLEKQHGEREEDMNHPHEEKVEEQPKVEVQKNEGENMKEDTGVQTLDEKEERSDGSQLFDSQIEIDIAEDVVKEVKQDTERATTKPQVVQGKKDAAVVSNDVIEETASKLREQRKNKVKALAGAFETVISLQDSK